MLKHGFIDFAQKAYEKQSPVEELVLVCAPPSEIPGILKRIRPLLSKNTLVMDAASVKQPIAAAMEKTLQGVCSYVPAHPIAGSEKAGPKGGSAKLFISRRVILCPDESLLSSPEVAKAKAFWEALGGKVECMPPMLHDQVYGYVSHLPQLLAFAAKDALEGCIAMTKEESTLSRFLRLGQSSGALWADIFLSNQAVIGDAIEHYLSVMAQIYNEFTSALVQEVASESSPESAALLFPRIAASCLVTTLSIVEEELGVKLLRFAGTGFADFAASAIEDAPEQDIERISRHYRDLLPVLSRYIQAIQRIRNLIRQQDSERLRSMLTTIQQRGAMQ